jgi:cysteine synthase
MSAFDLPVGVEDQRTRARTVRVLKDRRVRLPTFAELADPRRVSPSLRARLAAVDPDEPHALNLFRVNWFNGVDRRGQVDVPVFVELPGALTGVRARIIVALGALFPLIRAHKVLAAYACLVPRLVSGRFDVVRQRAVWPSTGNYCRGGVAISRILGGRGVALLPVGMSAERFEWLDRWAASPEDIIRTPGTESSVKAIYDRCVELSRDPTNVIINQFSEFANYLGHWCCTGPALGAIFAHLSQQGADLRLAAFVAASGSAGTLAAGDYLKETYGARIAVAEAVECPTLLKNGYGEHNIQGIGDQHVPLIHNVLNTDAVIGVTDRATDGLNAVFNTDVGRAVVADRTGVSRDVLHVLGFFGLSSLCNLVASIKLAKRYDLGPDDVVVTVATDGAPLYASERQRYLERHGDSGELTAARAAAIYGEHWAGAGTEHVLDASTRERERIFNLGYFTWVEQQGVERADFDRRRSQGFWRELRGVLPAWDELITAVNTDTGLAGRA